MQLVPSEKRAVKTREVANRWRNLTGAIPDAVELKFNTSLFTVGNAIDIQLAGDNVDDLRTAAEKISCFEACLASLRISSSEMT